MPKSTRKTRCLKGVKADDGEIIGQCIYKDTHLTSERPDLREHMVIVEGLGAFAWDDGAECEFEYEPYEDS